MAKHQLAYKGSSMYPTLKAGDILNIFLYNHGQRKDVGDIVAFQCPKWNTIVVHRIVSVCQKGLLTKGDNSLRNDDWVLSPNNIIGRINSVKRDGKNIFILNGFWGKHYVRFVRAMRFIEKTLLLVILSPIYHWLSDKRIFHILILNRGKFQLYCFKRGVELELQLLFDRRVIGRLLPYQKQWHIKRPFRLFVDKNSLPGHNFVDNFSSQHFFSNPKKI
jgi:signal peptidase I